MEAGGDWLLLDPAAKALYWWEVCWGGGEAEEVGMGE